MATSSSVEATEVIDNILKERYEHQDDTKIEDSEDGSDEEETYPEGGWRAWVCVTGSFFSYIVCMGLMNSVGAIQAYIEINQLSSQSSSVVSWIFSIYFFLSYALGILAGPIFDAYGLFWMFIVGSLLQVISLMLTSICTSFWHFVLAFGIVGGAGSSLLMAPTISVISHWFHRKRGMALGVSSIGGSVGGAVIPIMLRKLYTTTGFPWAMRILGFFSLGCLVLGVIMMETRVPKRRNKTLFGDVLDFSSLKDPRFAFCIIGNVFGELSALVTLTYLASYAINEGLSQTMAYLLITLVNISGIFGRSITGSLSDRFGRFNSIILATLLCVLSIWILWLPFGSHQWALIVFSLLYGFGCASIFSLIPVCVGQICKTNEFGKRFGTVYFFTAFSVLVGIPIAGALIINGSYKYLIVFNGLISTVGLGSWIMARYFCVGWSLRKIV